MKQKPTKINININSCGLKVHDAAYASLVVKELMSGKDWYNNGRGKQGENKFGQVYIV